MTCDAKRINVYAMTTGLSHIVADNVRAEMARRKKSQRDVAEALGTSQPAIYRRLAGEVAFDIDELGAVADLLDMDVRDLLPARSAPVPAAS